MQSVVPDRPGTVRETGASPWRGGGVSVGLHAAVVLVALGVLQHAVRMAPYKLPGTKQGVELLTYYSPGSVAHAPAAVVAKTQTKPKPAAVVKNDVPVPAPVPAQAASAEAGAQSSAMSGAGEGDISLALEKYFPYPKPDLTALPHGTRGDVIVDAVVGPDGKIAELTLVQGLGPAIDDVVMATVKQWSYTPAMKDGVPVPSKQELHFHYERG
jgi:protein TonB